jgi:hypothetical protein
MTERAEVVEEDTPCPRAPADDPGHCEHWYDDEAPCCRCGDDGNKVHGDHHPSLDCAVCAERINDGRTTYAQIYELAERRYQRIGRSF